MCSIFNIFLQFYLIRKAFSPFILDLPAKTCLYLFLFLSFRRVLNVICSFLVILRRLSYNCRRFGTHCRFHLHRQVYIYISPLLPPSVPHVMCSSFPFVLTKQCSGRINRHESHNFGTFQVFLLLQVSAKQIASASHILYHCYSIHVSANDVSPLSSSIFHSWFSRFNYELKHISALFWSECTLCPPLLIMGDITGETNDRLLYLKTQSVPRCKHFPYRL